MKNLTLIIGLLISTTFMATPLMATDYMGGIVKNGDDSLGIVCVSLDNDNNCEEFDVIKSNEGKGYSIATYSKVPVKTIVNGAKERARRELNQDYQGAFYIGTAFGYITTWVTKNKFITVPAIVAGVSIDIIKAPIVGTAFLIHKINDSFMKRRLRKLLKFMINPKKIGKSKNTRTRYFDAFQSALRNNN